MKDCTFRLSVHPTPETNFTLVGAPDQCSVWRLRDIDPDNFARIVLKAVSSWRNVFEEVPDFNVVIRTGYLVGHMHVVFIPRGPAKPKLNIPAGFEIATNQSIITMDPRNVAIALREHLEGFDQPSATTQIDPSVSKCLFCEGKTPPTLFCVLRDGTVTVPTDCSSFAAAVEFLHGRDKHQISTYYDLVETLAPHNGGAGGSEEVVRVFVNLTPAIVSGGQSNCVVVGLADRRYHGMKFTNLPVEIVAAFLRAFQFLEAVAEHRGLVLVPFFNCGPAAGGTVNCPHGQAYLIAEQPTLYREIAAKRKASGRCGVCETLRREELRII